VLTQPRLPSRVRLDVGPIVVIARSDRASRDARLSTGYGDVAIQEPQGARRVLDRFACARDDDLVRPNRIVL
jgi:hypothetical protein